MCVHTTPPPKRTGPVAQFRRRFEDCLDGFDLVGHVAFAVAVELEEQCRRDRVGGVRVPVHRVQLPFVEQLDSRDRDTERLYVLHDYFNPTAVVDDTGTVQERYGYDGFGTPRYMDADFGSQSDSDYEWETLFGAYRYDRETGR